MKIWVYNLNYNFLIIKKKRERERKRNEERKPTYYNKLMKKMNLKKNMSIKNLLKLGKNLPIKT